MKEASAKSRLVVSAVLFALVAALTGPTMARAADPDWKAVEQALGKPGQMQPGDVFRIGMPRTDLGVTVKGVPVKAGFALGSFAAFKQVGDHAMVMEDLVLLDQEVPAVMSGLFASGLEVTAVHNHLNEMTPHAMYMHYSGHGDVPRAENITELGQALLPAMGVVTVMNFQPTTDGKAAITGDFVLVDKEVNAVAKALRQRRGRRPPSSASSSAIGEPAGGVGCSPVSASVCPPSRSCWPSRRRTPRSASAPRSAPRSMASARSSSPSSPSPCTGWAATPCSRRRTSPSPPVGPRRRRSRPSRPSASCSSPLASAC